MLKKQWFEIVAPKMFDEMVIGESLAVDSKQLMGRKVEMNMMDLLKDYSKFYFKIKFQVDRIEDNRAFTSFMGHECMRERIYRMVQRHLRRVDCIQDVETSDNVKIRVKTIFVLTKRVGTSMKDATRKKAKELIEKAAKERSMEDFITMILSEELQHFIKKECSKIYPIGMVEVRKTEILKEKKKKESS